jgi:hypothetical protein
MSVNHHDLADGVSADRAVAAADDAVILRVIARSEATKQSLPRTHALVAEIASLRSQ